MKATILQGNVFDLLPTIERGSISCCVTSPPYWQLRSYLPKDHPLKALELGSEPTIGEFIANQVRVFSLVRECLSPWGTCWLNIGDSYASSNGFHRGEWYGDGGTPRTREKADTTKAGIPPGNLCLIPWRLALALQDDGWIVRSVIVWQKPSAMPASLAGWRWMRCRVKVGSSKRSVEKKAASSNGRPHGDRADNGKDFASQADWADCPGCKRCEPNAGYVLRKGSWRPTSSWEPVLMLAKQPGYFCDGESVKTAPALSTVSRDKYTRVLDDPDEQFAVQHDHETECTTGANLRDVWKTPPLESLSKEELIGLIQAMDGGEMPDRLVIAAEPLKEKHYAAFPQALVAQCLRAGTSARGYCQKCGSPWTRVLSSPEGGFSGQDWGDGDRGTIHPKTGGQAQWDTYRPPETLDWRASCKCEDAGDPRRGVVLDPFAGSGRTGLAARSLGLDFIGVELNPDYADMATRILRDDAPLFSQEEAPS